VSIENIKTYWLYLLGLPKTILFNVRYFPFMTAIKLPVFISHRVWLKTLKGTIELAEEKTGIVKIGFGEVAIFDSNSSRSIWHVSGKVSFKGRAIIGHGSKISVHGELILGDMFTISAESSIVVHKRITFGDNVMLSWEVLVMDTDLHEIYDMDNKLINAPREITVGDNVWIGCRSLVLKGSNIAQGVIIAAGTKIFGTIDDHNSIIGEKIPLLPIKNNVIWKR